MSRRERSKSGRAEEDQKQTTHIRLVHAVWWKHPRRPRVRRVELVDGADGLVSVGVPDAHHPVVERRREESARRPAEDVSLRVALASPAVKAEGVRGKVPVGRQHHLVGGLLCVFAGQLQLPGDANLVGIYADGLVEAMKAAMQNLHDRRKLLLLLLLLSSYDIMTMVEGGLRVDILFVAPVSGRDHPFLSKKRGPAAVDDMATPPAVVDCRLTPPLTCGSTAGAPPGSPDLDGRARLHGPVTSFHLLLNRAIWPQTPRLFSWLSGQWLPV